MDLWEIALGFMDSQMLLTADELGVFGTLGDGPRTAREIAAATGLPEDSAERLLVGLCGLGMIERDADGRFRNGEEAAEKLVPGRPGYIGGMFHQVRDDLYPLWLYFKEAVREGRAQWERAFGGRTPRNEEIHTDPGSLRAFHEGMHAISSQAARDFAEYAREELSGVGFLVDVGGSSGAFVLALAKAYPSLRAVVFDLPAARTIAEQRLPDRGSDDRLHFRGGDFLSDPLPAGADAYALGFVRHDWDTATGSRLLDRIAEAARPGSMLIIGEYLLNDEKTGPRWVARTDLNMLIAARGRERTAREYGDWVARHGFEMQRRIYLTSTGKNFMIARRR